MEGMEMWKNVNSEVFQILTFNSTLSTVDCWLTNIIWMSMHCEIKVAESDVDELVLLIKMIFILFNLSTINTKHHRSTATNEKIARPQVTQ